MRNAIVVVAFVAITVSANAVLFLATEDDAPTALPQVAPVIATAPTAPLPVLGRESVRGPVARVDRPAAATVVPSRARFSPVASPPRSGGSAPPPVVVRPVRPVQPVPSTPPPTAPSQNDDDKDSPNRGPGSADDDDRDDDRDD